MLGLDELRRLAVDLRARVDQVGRVELVAAVVALVAARLAVPADRAGALDVAVRQGAAGRRRDGAERRLLDHVAVVVDAAEQLLHDVVVVAGRGPGEEVVGQPEVDEVVDDDGVVLVGQLARGHALAVGRDQDRRAVLVGARDHEHVVARHPHVAAEHVGGHAETGHVADVARAVGVRPGDGGQDLAHECSLGGGRSRLRRSTYVRGHDADRGGPAAPAAGRRQGHRLDRGATPTPCSAAPCSPSSPSWGSSTVDEKTSRLAQPTRCAPPARRPPTSTPCWPRRSPPSPRRTARPARWSTRIGKGLDDRLAAGLAERRILERRDGKLLGLIPRTTWPAADTTRDDQLRRTITAAWSTAPRPTSAPPPSSPCSAAIDQAHKAVTPTTPRRGAQEARQGDRRGPVGRQGGQGRRRRRHRGHGRRVVASTPRPPPRQTRPVEQSKSSSFSRVRFSSAK